MSLYRVTDVYLNIEKYFTPLKHTMNYCNKAEYQQIKEQHVYTYIKASQTHCSGREPDPVHVM